jgi:hypothetical protein
VIHRDELWLAVALLLAPRTEWNSVSLWKYAERMGMPLARYMYLMEKWEDHRWVECFGSGLWTVIPEKHAEVWMRYMIECATACGDWTTEKAGLVPCKPHREGELVYDEGTKLWMIEHPWRH